MNGISKKFFQFWFLFLIAKLALAVWLPLSNDEAYYWVWSYHLQLSYYDHPPMVAWLFWLGHAFDFIGQGVRIPAVVLGHATLLIWYLILKPYLNETKLIWWLTLISLSPFLGLGSLIVTPDLPLIFFWSAALLFFHLLLLRPTAFNYFMLGATLGLGFCAKYHAVLFVPTALLYLGFSGRWRELRFSLIPVTFVSGLLFCAPVWFWNMQNDWVSFRFQLQHGLEGKIWKPSYPIEYVLAQVGLLFPPLVVFMFRRKEARELRWLEPFVYVPLLFFFYTSFKAHVEANWPIIAHPAALTLAFLNAPESPWIRRTIAVWALASIVVITQVAHPWLPLNPDKLKTSEFTRFDSVAQATQNLEPLYASTYQMAAGLSYRKKKMVYKVAGMSRRDFYDFLPMSQPNSDVFYLANEWDQRLPAELEKQGYTMKPILELQTPIKIFEVRRAQDSNR